VAGLVDADKHQLAAAPEDSRVRGLTFECPTLSRPGGDCSVKSLPPLLDWNGPASSACE